MPLLWEVSELETSMEVSEHYLGLGLLFSIIFKSTFINCIVSFTLKRPLFSFAGEGGRACGLKVGVSHTFHQAQALPKNGMSNSFQRVCYSCVNLSLSGYISDSMF